MSENMRGRVVIANNWLLEPCGACSLLVLTWMHQLETLLIVLHENQWKDTLFQGSLELFSPSVNPSVKRRALGSRLGVLPIRYLKSSFLCARLNGTFHDRWSKGTKTPGFAISIPELFSFARRYKIRGSASTEFPITKWNVRVDNNSYKITPRYSFLLRTSFFTQSSHRPPFCYEAAQSKIHMMGYSTTKHLLRLFFWSLPAFTTNPLYQLWQRSPTWHELSVLFVVKTTSWVTRPGSSMSMFDKNPYLQIYSKIKSTTNSKRVSFKSLSSHCLTHT